MGYYVNTDSQGNRLPTLGKYEALIADGGKTADNKWQENLICVVNNGIFEAAGYAYSEQEWAYFNRPDSRPKRWLTHPDAKKLAGYQNSKK